MYSPSYGGCPLRRRGGSDVTRKCPPPDDLQSMMRSDAVSAETVIPRLRESAKTPIHCPCRSTEISGASPTGLQHIWSNVKIVSERWTTVSVTISGVAETTMIRSKTSSDTCLIFEFSITFFFISKIYSLLTTRQNFPGLPIRNTYVSSSPII